MQDPDYPQIGFEMRIFLYFELGSSIDSFVIKDIISGLSCSNSQMSDVESNEPHIYDEKPEDGKFYLELPFWWWREVTEEQYNEEMARKTAYDNEERRRWELIHAFAEKLAGTGYNDIVHHGLHETRSGYYKKRLIEVLEQKWMKHISEAKDYTKRISSSESIEPVEAWNREDTIQTDITEEIFQTLQPSIVEHKDIYTHKLDELFAECERVVERQRVSAQQYDEILSLFEMSHINNPEYFLRFENLKRADTKYYYQRMYKFWYEYADKIPDGEQPQERQIMNYSELRLFQWAIWARKITTQEIEPNTELFHEKMKANFKHLLKQKMGGWWDPLYTMTLEKEPVDLYEQMNAEEQSEIMQRWKTVSKDMPTWETWDNLLTYERNWILNEIPIMESMAAATPWFPFDPIKIRNKNEFYNPLSSKHMQKLFWFSRDELNAIVEETKQEFMHEFISFFQKASFADLEMESSIVSLREVWTPWEAWKNAAPDYQLDITAAEQTIHAWLTRCFTEWLADFHDKLAKASEKKKYKTGIARRDTAVDRLYIAMKEMGIDDPSMHERKEQGSELKDKLTWTKKSAYAMAKWAKAQQKYGLPDEYTDDLSEKILSIVDQKLPDAAYGMIANEQRKQMGWLPFGMPNWMFTRLINRRVFLHEWLFGYMKFIIADDAQRKEFWENIRKEGWKNFFKKVQEKLMNPETADPKSMLLLKPILYQLRKYDVKAKDLNANTRRMKNNMFSYIHTSVEKELMPQFAQIEKYLQGNSKKEPWEVHNIFYMISSYLYSLLQYSRKPKTKTSKKNETGRIIENSRKDYFTYNMENFSGQYPWDYLMRLAMSQRTPEEMETLVSKDIIDAIIQEYWHVESLKKKFFAQLVQQWMQLNAMPGGKLQRVIEEQCVWIVDKQEAQQHAINYIVEHTEDIVVRDLTISLLGRDSLAPISDASKALIKELVQEVLEQRKSKLGQRYVQTDHTNRHTIV